MIQIDRTSDVSIHTQLSSRLRFLIASGHYSPGDILPSTRSLAKQLGISFHTVRRAYSTLEDENYLLARQGSGFAVAQFELPSKSARMEQGASIVHQALQQLLGLGLDDQEIDYLIQEQSSILETEDGEYKIILVGPFREWSDQFSELLSDRLHHRIISAVAKDLDQHADADFVIAPFRLLRSIVGHVPNADVIGVQTTLGADTLASVSEMLERETIGLVTGYSDAIGPLTSDIREQTRFGGQILAASVEHGNTHLEPVMVQSDHILYTEAARRSLKAVISKSKSNAEITFEISDSSIVRLTDQLPT